MRNPEEFPADIIAAAEIAVDRGWNEGVIDSICAAILAERLSATERAAKIAESVGNFGDYQRHELTADYGQPRYDMMVDIAAAIRSQP